MWNVIPIDVQNRHVCRVPHWPLQTYNPVSCNQDVARRHLARNANFSVSLLFRRTRPLTTVVQIDWLGEFAEARLQHYCERVWPARTAVWRNINYPQMNARMDKWWNVKNFTVSSRSDARWRSIPNCSCSACVRFTGLSGRTEVSLARVLDRYHHMYSSYVFSSYSLRTTPFCNWRTNKYIKSVVHKTCYLSSCMHSIRARASHANFHSCCVGLQSSLGRPFLSCLQINKTKWWQP